MRRAALPTLLMLIGTVAALAWFRVGLGWHDEGLMLQWGSRIGQGEWPYRDFWANYLPGQTLLQSVLGDSLITWRVVRALTGAAAAVVVYLLVARTESGRGWALGAWAGAALAFSWPLTAGPTASATLLALLALLAVPTQPVTFGVLVGLAAVFRPELGLAALAVGVLQMQGARRAQIRAGLAAAITTGLVLLPFSVVAGGALVDQVFGFASIQKLQRLPLVLDPGTSDPNKVLERMLPVLVLAAASAWALVAATTRRGRSWLPLLAVGAAYLAARADEFHLVPLTVVLALVAGQAGARAHLRSVRIFAVATLALIGLAGVDRLAGHARDAQDLTRVPLARAGGIRTDPATARSLEGLQRAVARRTDEGDPVLVLPPRIDRVRVGAPLLYTLLDRTNPTRYDVMQPGVVTTARVQRQMLADLEASNTKLVIRWLGRAAADVEDNGSAKSSGVTLLDDAIRARYRPVGRYGDFLLLARRQD